MFCALLLLPSPVTTVMVSPVTVPQWCAESSAHVGSEPADSNEAQGCGALPKTSGSTSRDHGEHSLHTLGSTSPQTPGALPTDRGEHYQQTLQGALPTDHGASPPPSP